LAETSVERHGKRYLDLGQIDSYEGSKRSRSLSPLIDESFDDTFADSDSIFNFDFGISTPDKSEDSENELPPSAIENASDIEWDAFLWEKDMLPASNWEEEFLEHKARFMSYYNYKGLVEGEEREESEDGEDLPWYPYDPETVLDPNLESDMEGVAFTEGGGGDAKICYGMVSVSIPLVAHNHIQRFST